MTEWKWRKAVSPEVALSHLPFARAAAEGPPRMTASWNFILPQFYHFVIFRAFHNFLFCFSSMPVLRSLLMPFNQFGCQPDPTILLFICLLTMNPNNFPWTNRDWKRKRQNKRKWNNNRSGTVWCSVPTIGSVKATRAEPSWLMRIWKGRQLSPHFRLGLLWYLIFPNFLFGDTKKNNILRDKMLRAISLMTFCLWPVREKPCSAQQWEKCSGSKL